MELITELCVTELCVNALLIGGTIVGLLSICLVGGCLIRGIVRLIKGQPVLADDEFMTCPFVGGYRPAPGPLPKLPKGNNGNNKTKE